MAQCVWALMDPLRIEHRIETTEASARNLLFPMIEILPHDELTHMMVTLWAMWTSRQ